jgi:hypothetical protein
MDLSADARGRQKVSRLRTTNPRAAVPAPGICPVDEVTVWAIKHLA